MGEKGEEMNMRIIWHKSDRKRAFGKAMFFVLFLFLVGCSTAPKAKTQNNPQTGYVTSGNLNNLNAQGETVNQTQSGTQNITYNNYTGLSKEQLIEELKSRDNEITTLKNKFNTLTDITELSIKAQYSRKSFQ